MKSIIIAGTRDFDDKKLLVKVCDRLLKNHKTEDLEIVSGEARGADTLGEWYADIRNYGEPKRFPAPWKDIEEKPDYQIGYSQRYGKYWKAAGHKRNKDMAEYADALIAFWDGKSTGTKSMIKYAKEENLKVFVYNYVTDEVSTYR